MFLNTYCVFSKALDDVIEISTGSLPIGRQIAHLNSSLLSEDILVHILVLLSHID